MTVADIIVRNFCDFVADSLCKLLYGVCIIGWSLSEPVLV